MTAWDNIPAPDPEFQALVRSRYAGQPGAMTALGARLLVGQDAPRSPADGAALIEEAARQGDTAAWRHLAVLAATGIGRKQSWAEGFDALVRAADGGDPSAARQLSLLGELGIRDATAVANWTTAVAMPCPRILLDEPRMTVYPGFLAHELCAHLIECAVPQFKPALVHDARQGGLRRDSMRTNTGAAFSLIETDFVIQMIRTRIATAAGVAIAALEPPEVLHYAPGERYNLHFDFFHPQLPHYAEEMQARGQRIRTCLVYLNAGYDGGETEFPKLNVRFRGGVGDALIFDNVTADGSGDVRTVHAGLPPANGEKCLLSQWIRDKPQPVA